MAQEFRATVDRQSSFASIRLRKPLKQHEGLRVIQTPGGRTNEAGSKVAFISRVVTIQVTWENRDAELRLALSDIDSATLLGLLKAAQENVRS
jgi:hypothetical protein